MIEDKRLLFVETIIGSIIIVAFLLMIFLSIFAIENIIWKVITIIVSFVIFIIGVGTCLLIEQKAGKYKYIPTYKQVLFAVHSGRTRYMIYRVDLFYFFFLIKKYGIME